MPGRVSSERWLSFIFLLIRANLSLAKGCFSHDAEVSMADGTRKQLWQVRPGDEVTSWDEGARRVAKSVVQAVPSYRRNVDEIMEVMLPQGAVLATVDHPFWSRSKPGLVSAHPRRTMQEYGLRAAMMSRVEQMEGEHNGTVHNVTAVWRLMSPVVYGRGRRSAAPRKDGLVEVTTLCLHPFHWFYVHGVRAHNKGCFVKTSEVSMASGLKKPLEHVRVGEEVISWDSGRQRMATSMVVVTPKYVREATDLVEIRLPRARIYATEDHPFWSKGRNTLVSARPSRTMEEYSLHAHSLVPDEVLEGEQLEDVRVSDILQAPQSALNSSWRVSNNSSSLEVMTLCLHPFPWFYVNGVRVHNKGCFAPWVRVMLSNGTEVAISSIRAQDHVVSWDTSLGGQADAKVLAVVAFPAARDQLLQLSFVGGTTERRLSNRSGLVLTADHPVYSARWGGAVSMQPEATLASHGLRVGQLEQQELLQHYLGHDVEATVEPWLGDLPLEVMTLQLERHHWFYAEGVRVHNKGGSFRTSSGGISSPVYHSNSHFGSHDAHAMFILAYNRRRYGVWLADDGGCIYTTEANTSGVQEICTGSVGEMSACERCDQCTVEACVKNISNCSLFLSNLYEGCRDTSSIQFRETVNVVFLCLLAFLVLFPLVLLGSCLCYDLMLQRHEAKVREHAKEKEQRLAMRGENGQGLVMVAWKGSYAELGETKGAEYRWSFNSGGHFTGSGTDDDGIAEVKGVVVWRAEASEGQVRWSETRPGVSIEACGSLSFRDRLVSPQLSLRASYKSSTGVCGSTTLLSTQLQMEPAESPRQEELPPSQEDLQPLMGCARQQHGFFQE